MKSKEVINYLEAIRDRLRRVLDSNVPTVIDRAIRDVGDSKRKYDAGSVPDWGYTISRDSNNSLRFKSSTHKGYGLQADIMCDMRWRQETKPPCRHNAELRIWSTNRKIMYREHLDSRKIGEMIDDGSLKRRVVLRCHFDRAKSGANELKHHMQMGGISTDDEYCWIPTLDIPRLIYQPVEVVLLCQMVVANFFPEQYESVYRDPVMRNAVMTVQEYFLKPYYDKCHKAISTNSVLLDELYKDDPTL